MATKAKATAKAESIPFPRIEIRGVDKGIALIWTPLGGGKWRAQTTADGGDAEVDGGLDAVWDGTTLVIFNAHQDTWGHFTWFDPAVAPVVIADGEGADG